MSRMAFPTRPKLETRRSPVCAVSNDEDQIICNKYGKKLDVLVSEIAYRHMAEALQRIRSC